MVQGLAFFQYMNKKTKYNKEKQEYCKHIGNKRLLLLLLL